MTEVNFKTLVNFCFGRLERKAKTDTVMIHLTLEAETFNSVGRHFAVTCLNFIAMLTMFI